MFTNTLPGNTESVLKKLGTVNFTKDFYLTGGTALAVQIGHRESEDLDFFTQKSFEPEKIQKELETIGKPESVEISRGTLNCFLDNVKLQFLYYPHLLLEPKLEWENIQISSRLDIACTKLITISSRGSKKDFIDIYFLLKEYDLQTLFNKLNEKYPKTDYNETHILKSLVYFEDANGQPLPRMHKDIAWEKVKEEIISKVKNFQI
nr:nucleotidyl transferase AbiEii/AbiGii toxin family protein [Candidatus Levybacteria bacterium]